MSANAAVPTKAELLHLYRRYLSTARSFSAYPFRTYFLRRSRDLFRSSLLPASQAATTSPFSREGDATTLHSPPSLNLSTPSFASTAPEGSSDADRLKAFYDAAVTDLEVLKRAALINRMYEGERLVVEKPQFIVSGGGAGMEASAGGGGQPDSGPKAAGRH